jgi:hypothetical protein
MEWTLYTVLCWENAISVHSISNSYDFLFLNAISCDSSGCICFSVVLHSSDYVAKSFAMYKFSSKLNVNNVRNEC